MYHAYYGIEESPFSITPDPRYLYMSRGHQEALAHLVYGVSESGGFVLLTGEVGTGKTSVCRALLEQLPDLADVALIINPRMSEVELVASIGDELGVERPAEGTSLKDLVDELNRHLLALHAKGRHAVVIIDEAQNLSPAVLEQVRLLTNLETPTRKLLQIILVGQPELSELLEAREMRQLAQRVTARYHLKPLSRAETKAYIRHRLLVGGLPSDMFSDRAIAAIYRRSRGVPRLINSIGDRCLLGAYAQNLRRIDRGLAVRAAREVLGEGRPAFRRPLIRGASLGLAGLAAAGLVAAGLVAALVPGERIDPRRLAGDLRAAWDELAVFAAAPWASETGGEPPAATPVDTAEDDGQRDPEGARVRPADQSIASDAIAVVIGDKATIKARAPALDKDLGRVGLMAQLEVLPAVRDADDWSDGPSEERIAHYAAGPILIPRAGPVTPPRPADLATLVKAVDPDHSRHAAAAALFELWRIEAPGDGADICAAAAAASFHCVEGSGGWEALSRVDRPALITLRNPGGRAISAVLEGLSGDWVKLRIGDERIETDRNTITPLWSRDYLALWRPPAIYRRVLVQGARGEDVAWVKNRLSELAGLGETVEGEALFDEELLGQVIDFQKRRGLTPDGIVGKRTILQLSIGLPGTDGPRLGATGT